MLGRFSSIVTPFAEEEPPPPPPDEVPPGFHVIDPGIDASGATDVTVDLNAWRTDIYDTYGEGSASKVLKIWVPAGAKYQHNDQFSLGQQYELWRTSPNNVGEFRNPVVFPFRGQPVAATNPQGFVAPAWYEVTGDFKRFGWTISAANSGPGGVGVVTRLDPDTYTDVYGKARSGLFRTDIVGKACELWYFDPSDTKDPGPDGRGAFGRWKPDPHGFFSIASVSANRKQVTLNAAVRGSPTSTSFPTQDRFFSIVPKGDFENVFMPNPGWNRLTFTGDAKVGNAAFRAAGYNARRRPDGMFLLSGHHNRVLDVNFRGPNPAWLQANYNSGYTDPIEYENHHLVAVNGSHCAIGSSVPVSLTQPPIMRIHHGFGHALRVNDITNGWAHDLALHDVGRQGFTMSWGYGMTLERAVLYGTHGAVTDNEPTWDVAAVGTASPPKQFFADNPYGPGQAQFTCDWVHYKDIIFGAETLPGGNNSDLAGSADMPVGHILFERMRSLTPQVAAALIPKVTDFRAPKYGMSHVRTIGVGRAGHVIHRDCETDVDCDNWTFAYGRNYLFENWERHGRNSGEGAVKYVNCLNYKSRGCTIQGVLDSKQYEATPAPSSFVEPGTPGGTGDWWWDQNAPDPPNYWRDL